MTFILGREEVEQFVKLQAKDLNAEVRLLHIIICWILLHRSGRFDLITERDIVLMYHIVREIPLNLPKLMIQSMKEAVNRTQASLPYAMALTHVFKCVGVQLWGEQSCRLGRASKIGEAALHRMHFQKINGEWVRSRGAAERIAMPKHEEEEELSSPTTQAGPSDEPTLPSEQMAGAGHELQNGTNASPSIYRVQLMPDQIRAIATEIASIIQSSHPTFYTESFHVIPPGDSSLVPHIFSIFQLLGEILSRLEHIESTLFRLTDRLFDVDREVREVNRLVTAIRNSGSDPAS